MLKYQDLKLRESGVSSTTAGISGIYSIILYYVSGVAFARLTDWKSAAKKLASQTILRYMQFSQRHSYLHFVGLKNEDHLEVV